MDEEIVLDRGNATVMKLDADEQALMDEIHISAPKMHMPKRPVSNQPRRPQQPRSAPQEEIDAFANPNKQAPPPKFENEEVDYGEDEPMFYDDEGDAGMYEQQEDQEERQANGFNSVDEEKADILNKLARLEKKGFNV